MLTRTSGLTVLVDAEAVGSTKEDSDCDMFEAYAQVNMETYLEEKNSYLQLQAITANLCRCERCDEGSLLMF
jgi:hypothetical protein